MEFSAQQDMETPISEVFEMLSSFEDYERAAVEHGAQVHRSDTLESPGVGMTWNVQFDMRGRNRAVEIEVVEYKAPDSLALQMKSQGLHGTARVELLALSPARTRVTLALDVQARTLPARVLLQPLKLTKSTLDARLQGRVTRYLAEMEECRRRA